MTAPKLKPKPKGLDRPSTTKVIKAMSTLNTWLYRATGGRVGKTWRIGSALRKGVPICLVTTTGAKSGEPRTVPLCYLGDGANIVLVASQVRVIGEVLPDGHANFGFRSGGGVDAHASSEAVGAEVRVEVRLEVESSTSSSPPRAYAASSAHADFGRLSM